MQGGPARWTKRRCVREYERRTGRCASDDARLGWALAVRAHIHQQALRAFANVGRRRALRVCAEWPAWVQEGVEALQDAFGVYEAIEPGWNLLCVWPTITADLGLLAGGAPTATVEAAIQEAVARAQRELDLSVGARARHEAERAFFAGVAARRTGVTPADVQLLAIAVGIEDPPTKLDAGRRRWAERAARWALSREEQAAPAGLVAADALLDARSEHTIDRLLEALGVSDRLDSARGPKAT
jgi:hypothetical protein